MNLSSIEEIKEEGNKLFQKVRKRTEHSTILNSHI